MADRTAAAIFGMIFEKLAKNPTAENKELAKEIFGELGGYDFNEYQMYVDDALITLGLARRGLDPDYPEDGETILYGTENQN
jgi:hypothetical protein